MANDPKIIANFKKAINELKGATRNVAEKLPFLSLKPDNSYEATIGRPVMSRHGGTEIEGRIDSRINPDLPPEMSSGKVDLFIHEHGLRIRKQLGATFLLPIESVREISQQGQAVTKKTGAMLDLAGKVIDGGIHGGAVGAGLAAGKGVLTGDLGSTTNTVSFYVRIVFHDGRRDRMILIETSEAAATQFVDRVREQFSA